MRFRLATQAATSQLAGDSSRSCTRTFHSDHPVRDIRPCAVLVHQAISKQSPATIRARKASAWIASQSSCSVVWVLEHWHSPHCKPAMLADSSSRSATAIAAIHPTAGTSAVSLRSAIVVLATLRRNGLRGLRTAHPAALRTTTVHTAYHRSNRLTRRTQPIIIRHRSCPNRFRVMFRNNQQCPSRMGLIQLLISQRHKRRAT